MLSFGALWLSVRMKAAYFGVFGCCPVIRGFSKSAVCDNKKEKATLEKSLSDLPSVKEPNLSDITSQGQGSYRGYQESQGDMVTCQSEDIMTRINRHPEKFQRRKHRFLNLFFD